MNNRLLLVLPGSFDPVTNAHIKILKIARDFYLKLDSTLNVKAVLIPTSDKYDWKKLTENHHRFEMCKLTTKDYAWMNVSNIEMKDKEWRRTRFVLEDFSKNNPKYKLKFVCGIDKINELKHWQYPDDIVKIRDLYGFACIQRGNNKIDATIVERFELVKKLDLIPTAFIYVCKCMQ